MFVNLKSLPLLRSRCRTYVILEEFMRWKSKGRNGGRKWKPYIHIPYPEEH